MSVLDLSIDALLTTTRSVRKRLDLSRRVEPEMIRECLSLALQAPTGGNSQDWHFVVVTDPEPRQALATLYRKGAARYVELMTPVFQQRMATSSQEAKTLARMIDSGQYLSEHLHEVPVHVIPCIQGRTDHLPIVAQCFAWGSILPAAWSFMLAARSRGLGTSLTGFHLYFEQEAAEVLGIPYEQVMQRHSSRWRIRWERISSQPFASRWSQCCTGIGGECARSVSSQQAQQTSERNRTRRDTRRKILAGVSPL